MPIKIGISGFGRIGRCITRAICELNTKDIQVIKINATGHVESNIHLLKYDSIHGKFDRELIFSDGVLRVDDSEITLQSERDPNKLNWEGVDIVLECTGKFNSKEQSSVHITNGAKKVLISAPADGVDKTIVYGVNHETLLPTDKIVSNASCTTNCLAPIAKILNENLGIKKGFMTTIHSYTGDQPTVDRMHKDLYRARSAALSMIPTTTGAAKAVGLVLPELAGKLDGSAVRVPTANVSLVDLKVITNTKTSIAEVNHLFELASKSKALKGILGYSSEPLVSTDYNHDINSAVFAANQTNVMDGNLVRTMSWYDNEWGFSNRMLDTAIAMGSL
ncbi:MAG: type I glyceraldehyde-3-phosphate dehydrogenase [Paracoccaceae bacterium]